MKHFLQQMKRDALAPPRRAWAMRHWALSLLLIGNVTVCGFNSQGANALGV